MYQYNRRRIYTKTSFYLFVLVALGFVCGSFIVAKRVVGETAALFAPNLSATKTAALDTTAGGDLNLNNIVNPGDRLTYTVTINNSGADPATGVNFSDTLDANTTLVGGSVIASAVAVNDTYSSIGNVGISIPDGATDLLANDLNPNGAGTLTIVAPIPTTSAQGGQVSINTTSGAFTYNPAPGFEGADSFTYTLSNGTGLNDTATVNITVSGMIWFVNASAGAGGDGRLNSPFNCFVGTNCFDDTTLDQAGDNIFLYSGAYTGGQTLLANQRVIGQGATASLSAITGISVPVGSLTLPATGGARPAVTTTVAATSAFTLAATNTMRGFDIGNTTAADITGASVGTFTASEMTLGGTGRALDINGGTLAATFDSITSTSSGSQGIALQSVGGALAATSGTAISGSTTQGVFVSASTVNANFGNTSIAAGTDGVSLQNNSAGTRTFGTLSTTNGSGVGFLHANGGGLTSITGAATFTNPGGRCVDIQNAAASNGVTFANVNATQCGGTGVFLNANAGAVTFADLDISPDAGQRPFHATNNTGAITTTSGTIPASGTAVSVEITNASGTVPLNMQFTSVSATGAASGIILTNTSSTGSPGGFRVLGNGGTCSSVATCTGGAIQNSTNHGVSLTNVSNPSFTRLAIQNATRNGLDGQQVTNFTIDNSFIDNVGTGAAGQYDESNIAFNDGGLFTNSSVSGTISITNNTLANARRHGIQIENGTGTIANLTVSDNTITSSTSAADSLGHGVLVSTQGTASTTSHLTTGTINHNAITNFPSGSGIFVTGGSGSGTNNTSATLGANGTPINITNNTVRGQSAANRMGSNAIIIAFNGQVGVSNFNISCNGNTNTGLGCSATNSLSNYGGLGISVFMGGTVTGGTTVNNNVLVSNNTAGSSGIAIQADDGPAGLGTSAANISATINGNNVSANEGSGVRAIARASSATLKVTIKGNTVAAPTLANRDGIRIDAGSAAGNSTVCADIGGAAAADKNITAGSGLNSGIGLRRQTTNTNVFGIEGMGATSSPGVEQYVDALNTSQPGPPFGDGNGVILLSGTTGFSNCSSAPFAKNVDEFNSKQSNGLNDNLSFLNSTYQSSSENFTSAPPLLQNSAIAANQLNEKIADFETIIQANGIVSASERIETHDTDYRTKISTFLSDAANFVSESVGKLDSLITPTAYAQENAKVETLAAPESGENVSKSLGALPNGEQIVVQFKATVDANIPTNDFSVSNTANITADGGININSTTATTTVVQPASITKSFGAAFVIVGNTTTLTFTVANGNASPLTNVSFTDPLPSGLRVADTPGVVNNCGGGTVTAAAGATSFSYAGGARAATSSCMIQVNVKGTSEGVQNNVTGAITSTEGGAGNTASATLSVINAPIVAKSFAPASIPLNSTSLLSISIQNTNASQSFTGVNFTDTLPIGVTAPNATSAVCGGTLQVSSNVVSLSGGSVTGNSTCTANITVTGTTAGLKSNTVTINTTNTGTNYTASATLTVIAPPTIAKSFSPTGILVNGTSVLTISITNPAANTIALTGVGVTDNFPAGSEVASTPSSTNSCSTGSFAPAAGATSITISGATIPVNITCTFSVQVKATTSGEKINTTGAVTSSNGGAGGTASATLTVNQPNYSVTGTVSYGTTVAGDPAKYVADVLLTAVGTPQATATTDSVGIYSISNLGAGAYTVTPTKADQSDNTGISVQDASEAAKIAININTTPTASQTIAADATGDGTISLQDASEIAKRAFNIASTNTIGQWKFLPATRSYPNLSSNLSGQDFQAILVGDVTGNWTPPANALQAEAAKVETVKSEQGERFSEKESIFQQSESNTESFDLSNEQRNSGVQAAIPVSLPNTSGSAGTTVLIPVTVGDVSGQNITAYDLTVSFDSTVLEPTSPAFDASGTLTAAAGGYSVFVDPTQPAGRLRVGAFGTAPLSGQGALIYLRFNVLAGAATTAPLNFVQFIFAEGRPQDAQATTTNGSFMRLGPTAAEATITGRVLTAKGRGIFRARVEMIDQNGEVKYASTNPFGYYRFADIAAGGTFVLSVSHKQYRFDSQVISLIESMSEVNFIATESVGKGNR